MGWAADGSKKEEAEDSSGVGNGVGIGSADLSSILGGGSDDHVEVSS